MKIEAILFDMDGTLIDSEPLYEESDRIFLAKLGISIPDAAWPSFVGMGSRAFILHLQKEYGLKLGLEEAMKLKDEAYIEIAKSQLKVFPEVLEFAKKAKAAGKKTAIASGSTPEAISFCVDVLGIRKYFDFFISANQVKEGKPAPDIFVAAAKHFALSAQSCLVLEDSVFGVEAASRAGMPVLAFPYTESLRHDDRFKLANWLLDGNASTFKADSFIKNLSKMGLW